jgi:hypothetical protein
MIVIDEMEKTVLMYLESSLDSKPEGMRLSEMAESLGEPMKNLIAVCQKLNQRDMLCIDHTYMAEGQVTDLKLRILGLGIDTLFENEKGDTQ